MFNKRLYRSESLVLKVRDNINALPIADFIELTAILSPFQGYPEIDGDVKRYIQTPDQLRPEILKYTSNLRLVDGSAGNMSDVFWFEKPIDWCYEISPDAELINAEYYGIDPKGMSSKAAANITVLFPVSVPSRLITDDIENTFIYNSAAARVESTYALQISTIESQLKATIVTFMEARGYTVPGSATKAQLVEMIKEEYAASGRLRGEDE